MSRISSRNHEAKTLAFDLRAKNESQQKKSGAEAAHIYMSGLKNYFESSTSTHLKRTMKEQKRGHIDASTKKEHIEKYASDCGMIDMCNSMLRNPPPYEAFEHFNSEMNAAADPRGDTYTKAYDDMRCYGGAKNAKARASNTGIEHGKFLHLYPQTPSQNPSNRHPTVTSDTSSLCEDYAVASNAVVFEQSNDDIMMEAASSESLTPPDLAELRETVVGEMMFGDETDTVRNKKLQILSDELHLEEVPKQTMTKLAVLKKNNITSPKKKVDLLLKQIKLVD